jgi:hypothetical protein
MKTQEQITDAADALDLMLLQPGISDVQFATLCGMVTVLRWAADDLLASLVVDRLLERGFVKTQHQE